MPNHSFLGKNCVGGLSAGMQAKLVAAEAVLTGQYLLSGFPGSITEWAGLRQDHGAMHPGGQHTTGDAIDVNYESNPYIATRTPTPASGVTFGGEATSTAAPPATAVHAMRLQATAVYDRAVAFVTNSASVANVSARAATESTTSVFQRFGIASNALQRYLQLVFRPTLPAALTSPPRLTRTPVTNAFSASMRALLTGIPASERWSDADAKAGIAAIVSDPAFSANHPGWSTDVNFWFTQIMRDFEVVRIPMQFGPVSLSPASTRNPANGFLDLRHEIIVALASDPPLLGVMRWGICDFGAVASGDVMHFDLAGRNPSGVPGSTPPDVRIDLSSDTGIQQALGTLGFDIGSIDGKPGQRTLSAITKFRASRTPPLPSGGVDTTLRSALSAALVNAAVPFERIQ